MGGAGRRRGHGRRDLRQPARHAGPPGHGPRDRGHAGQAPQGAALAAGRAPRPHGRPGRRPDPGRGPLPPLLRAGGPRRQDRPLPRVAAQAGRGHGPQPGQQRRRRDQLRPVRHGPAHPRLRPGQGGRAAHPHPPGQEGRAAAPAGRPRGRPDPRHARHRRRKEGLGRGRGHGRRRFGRLRTRPPTSSSRAPSSTPARSAAPGGRWRS